MTDGGPIASDAGQADASTVDGSAAVEAGMDGAALAPEDACGPRLDETPVAAEAKAVVQNGLVEYHASEGNEFVGVEATLTVPEEPPPSGVIFVWPGTQAMPGPDTMTEVGEGVLQPVLTWGPSCVPGSLQDHSTWWISGVYVNSETWIPELRGCHGGPVITVDVGDRLDLEMRLEGTIWDQTITDRDNQKSTDFSIDLRGQPQRRAVFWIELKTQAKPTEDILFEDVVLTLRDPDPEACVLNNRGTNDYVSRSRVSADGRHCCIERMILRAEGVTATMPDP